MKLYVLFIVLICVVGFALIPNFSSIDLGAVLGNFSSVLTKISNFFQTIIDILT